MKIALIRKEYTLKWGGAERYVVTLSRLLADRGHEVHVFAHSWDLPADPRITFHTVPVRSWYSPFKNLSFALNTRNMLKGEQFDIINGFSQVFPQDIYRAGDGIHRHNLDAQSSTGLARTLHHLNPRHRVILHIEGQIFKPGHYTHVIANSNLCKQQILNHYDVPEDRVTVIYNGVDLNRFHPGVKSRYRSEVRKQLGISDETRLMLYVSRNYSRKGLRQLIESIALLGEKKHLLKLVVVGRGTTRPYRRLAAALGVADTISFAGEEPMVERYYGASDFLMLPTLYDPFSNVCLEALACGLPVITTRSNGAAELISDGVNGYVLADARDAEEMAAKISLMIPDGTCRSMGERAAVSARRYTLEDNLQKTLGVYDTVLSAKRRFAFSRHNGMMINREYAGLLNDNHLCSFNQLMDCTRGTAVKQVSGLRSTVKFGLKNGNDETGVYLKRYHHGGMKVLVGSLPGFSVPATAMDELNAILTFHRFGIPTMIPLAAGARKTGPATGESFLLTRELEGTERLDHYLAREMITPLSPDRRADKRQLIKQLALLVRRMHGSGLNHRDLYLCHLLVKKTAAPAWTIYVADLHRVEGRSRMPLRWKVKDLAALNYSADQPCITRTDRLRFMHRYWDGATGDPPLKLLIRRVLRKTERIRAHDRRLQRKKSNRKPTGNAVCEKIF